MAQPPETPSQKLTNDDFRKLLATPRPGAPANLPVGSVREAGLKPVKKTTTPISSDRIEARRKKKHFYAALKKQEDNKLAELSEKYRDRARERRDGANPDYQNAETPGHGNNAYRAVAPDVKSGIDAAERRRRIIQESKFLGGDMEHTHLVKGLDYALLQKVRSELQHKEDEQEKEMEKVFEEKEITLSLEEQEFSNEPTFNTVLGKNIYNTILAAKSKEVVRHEHFMPGRMAYIIDLDDDNAESDIPTTLVRSKYDVPVNHEDTNTLTTNDIVINKLSQILSYLRSGGRNKKNRKRDKDKPLFNETNDNLKSFPNDNIYDDIGDYNPQVKDDSRALPGSRSPLNEEQNAEKSFLGGGNGREGKNYFQDEDVPHEPSPPKNIFIPQRISKSMVSKFSNEPQGYAECYPGLEEMNDAIDDSDDEVDYTKMDLGNKKGPIGRWDFDTQEEYSDYMSTKEALPKAAFQYGVKMQDGRKTRKNKTDKNERAELDREWQKIQTIIQKRKTKKSGDEPEYKISKF
ncbi:protein Red [Eupeodes corollae]|uniref:protein Red n=1 Tax=Eupeodes corollae TaxID=290404 RepID=UPI00248FD80A|nr:protein Red [Eupeodes corollae]XP_055914263.1 protein Red [Eupeodes corollae]